MSVANSTGQMGEGFRDWLQVLAQWCDHKCVWSHSCEKETKKGYIVCFSYLPLGESVEWWMPFICFCFLVFKCKTCCLWSEQWVINYICRFGPLVLSLTGSVAFSLSRSNMELWIEYCVWWFLLLLDFIGRFFVSLSLPPFLGTVQGSLALELKFFFFYKNLFFAILLSRDRPVVDSPDLCSICSL